MAFIWPFVLGWSARTHKSLLIKASSCHHSLVPEWISITNCTYISASSYSIPARQLVEMWRSSFSSLFSFTSNLQQLSFLLFFGATYSCMRGFSFLKLAEEILTWPTLWMCLLVFNHRDGTKSIIHSKMIESFVTIDFILLSGIHGCYL